MFRKSFITLLLFLVFVASTVTAFASQSIASIKLNPHAEWEYVCGSDNTDVYYIDPNSIEIETNNSLTFHAVFKRQLSAESARRIKTASSVASDLVKRETWGLLKLGEVNASYQLIVIAFNEFDGEKRCSIDKTVYFDANDKATDLRKEQSVRQFKKATGLDEDFYEAAFSRLKPVKDILVRTEILAINPNDGQAYKKRASDYLAIGNTDAALTDFNKAIEINPEDFVAYFGRGMVYITSSNLETYYNVFGLHTTNREKLKSNQESYGFVQSALVDFNKAIELNPDEPRLYVGRIPVYLYLMNDEAALQDCTTLIELEPERAVHYARRGDIYEKYFKDYESAIKDFTSAIELAPKHAEFYSRRSNLYKAIGNKKLARADHKKWLRLVIYSR